MRLANKVAIVTGGARGMGEASALLFAKEGAKVAVVDLVKSEAEATVARIREEGGTAFGIEADVSRVADVKRIVDETVSELGLPTVLFNNAGVDLEDKRLLVDTDEAAFDRTIEVNLKGPWLMMKYVAPRMIEAGGGSIINTASIGAFVAASTAGYCASKAGVVAMTRVAAVELGEHGIRVNALCPGATASPMAAHQRAELEAAGVKISDKGLRRLSALGRMADVEEMAKMALFLASDDSSFATGAPFINDGGWTSISGVPRRT